MSSSSPILSSLPEEIIVEILSYLPVRSLLRFKCVHKNWNAITQDFQFMCLHSKRSPMKVVYQYGESTSNAVQIVSASGLQLERTVGPNYIPFQYRYRVHNPELHQILRLPDPPKPRMQLDLVVDSYTGLLKCISPFYVFENRLKGVGYHVLDLQHSPYLWLPLHETPLFITEKYIRQLRFQYAMGTAYCIFDTSSSDIEVDILDIVNDRYIGHTTISKDFYSVYDAIIWNKKLAFAKIVKEDEELHVLVLDDYKKQIWAQGELVIKLTFLKEAAPMQEPITVQRFGKSELWFCWRDKESVCTYNITTGKLTTIFSGYNKSNGEFLSKPVLFGFNTLDCNVVVY